MTSVTIEIFQKLRTSRSSFTFLGSLGYCVQVHSVLKSNQNLSLYLLDYAEECNELAGRISASLRPGNNTASFEEMSQRWRAVGNTVSDLTGPRFEAQTSRSRDERVTARLTGRYSQYLNCKILHGGTLLRP